MMAWHFTECHSMLVLFVFFVWENENQTPKYNTCFPWLYMYFSPVAVFQFNLYLKIHAQSPHFSDSKIICTNYFINILLKRLMSCN